MNLKHSNKNESQLREELLIKMKKYHTLRLNQLFLEKLISKIKQLQIKPNMNFNKKLIIMNMKGRFIKKGLIIYKKKFNGSLKKQEILINI